MNLKSLRLLLIAVCSYSIATADEIEDALKAALSAHQQGKTADVQTALRRAQELMAAKETTGLQAVLPPQIADWKGGKIETQSLESAGTVLRRNYKKGSKELGDEKKGTVLLTLDSPAVDKLTGFLSKPELAALLGNEAVTLPNGIQGIYNKKVGLMQFLLKKKQMLAIEGKKLKKDELLTLAKGVNYAALKSE
jgi:hypothetical protein